MKQFLSSVFCIALLFSGSDALARNCGNSSEDRCGSTLNSNCNTGCNTGCNTSTFTNNCNNCTVGSTPTALNQCNTNCGDCSNSCSNSSKSCSSFSDGSCSDSCSNSCDLCCSSRIRTSLHYRSQGANTARELVGWQWELNKPDMCEPYGASYIAFEYQRTFRSHHIAKALFGGSTLRFAGSLVPDRTTNELVADNFGLSRTFRGSLHLKPRIENFIVDLGFYAGLDCWCPGLYFRLHAPIVHTRWKLNTSCPDCCDLSPTTTQACFDSCYVGSTPNPTATPLGAVGFLPVSTTTTPGTFAAAVNNVAPATSIEQALSGDFLFGDMQTPWCAGKFDFCRRTRNGLADIDLILGYNFCNTDCYHFGLYAQAVLPTGRKQRNEFVFDPVVGNGGFFELGLGVSAHSVLWCGEDANLAFFLEGNVTHMFKNRQCRLFDFCKNGAFSRYLLLKEFDSNGTALSYNGKLISATCFNNRLVDVRIDVKGDASLKLAYRWCGFGFDIGYNLYGHSHEKIRFRCDSCPCDVDNRRFGIKGTEGVCCFNYTIADVTDVVPGAPTVPSVFPAGAPFDTGFGTTVVAPAGCPELGSVSVVTSVYNNGTQPTATAFDIVRTPVPTTAAGACSVCLASNSANVSAITPVSELTPANGFFIANTTRPNASLNASDLNIRSGEAPSVLTHKIFAHLNYTWMDECGWNPHFGVGGEVEFTGNRFRDGGCRRAGGDYWGVWFKGGVSF